MKAINLLKIYREELIGKEIMTYPMGEYQGGPAIITKICPDENAKEIVFNAKNKESNETIGFFYYEEIDLKEDCPIKKLKDTIEEALQLLIFSKSTPKKTKVINDLKRIIGLVEKIL